ncbi:MAG: methylmalonyl Co-A mutase-associated GTPase MeaB [Firmicutes bacterium]|nr:methylmalonyl Co-A mutase-associated GTPase MeaB [Bacillota bacterium]
MFDNLDGLIEAFNNGHTRALARVISRMENDDSERYKIIENIYPRTGKAYVLGITGAPGAGKSSLIDKLLTFLREKGDTVGVIVVDPTSPFTGGALLGDRIRMEEHFQDSGIFIRSMGSRGNQGGLAKTTQDVVKAMDAFGFQWVIVETVGVGQTELDIMHVVDTNIVVLTPGAGDSIQMIKAGIMEIADIFVVNKCDLPGADKVAADIEMMQDLRYEQLKWRPPVVKMSAINVLGFTELLESIEKHHFFLKKAGLLDERRKKRAANETLDIVNYQLRRLVKQQAELPGKVNEILNKVALRQQDPYSAAVEILKNVILDSKFFV